MPGYWLRRTGPRHRGADPPGSACPPPGTASPCSNSRSRPDRAEHEPRRSMNGFRFPWKLAITSSTGSGVGAIRSRCRFAGSAVSLRWWVHRPSAPRSLRSQLCYPRPPWSTPTTSKPTKSSRTSVSRRSRKPISPNLLS